jgi:Cu(I)/Ag(I) efflux system membrane fusion protein
MGWKVILFENVMVETGVAKMVEITSEMDSSKKSLYGAYAINSEYIFRKGSDPTGMKM